MNVFLGLNGKISKSHILTLCHINAHQFHSKLQNLEQNYIEY